MLKFRGLSRFISDHESDSCEQLTAASAEGGSLRESRIVRSLAHAVSRREDKTEEETVRSVFTSLLSDGAR